MKGTLSKKHKHRNSFLSFGLLILLSASCSIQSNKPSTNVGLMARLPVYTIEATVLSVSLDINQDCLEKCPGYEYPKDSAMLRIDKILLIDNPDNVGGKGFQEGSDINVQLLYSSRPAKIIYKHSNSGLQNVSPDTPALSIPSFAQPIPFDNGYFVFTVDQSVQTESPVVLPGLQPGSKLRTAISLETPTKGTIAEYEIIQ